MYGVPKPINYGRVPLCISMIPIHVHCRIIKNVYVSCSEETLRTPKNNRFKRIKDTNCPRMMKLKDHKSNHVPSLKAKVHNDKWINTENKFYFIKRRRKEILDYCKSDKRRQYLI